MGDGRTSDGAAQLVLTRDQHDPTGPLVRRRITRTYQRTAHALQLLIVRDENGVEQTLKVTEEHPFYRESDGWTPARKLDAGDIILGADGTLTVVSNEAEQQPGGVTVYNLEVEQAHTYFVIAEDANDAAAVWVHNANYPVSPSAALTARAQRAGGYVDPRTNKWTAAGRGEVLAADHIYPKSLIMKMPGFDRLSRSQQDWLLNHPGNLEPLPKSWNSSKKNRLADDWSQNTPMGRTAHRAYIDQLRERQTAYAEFAEAIIGFWGQR